MTVEQITEAAIDVADEGGLAALSMASVAQRLGCTKMALYRYVEAKEDLQALMLDGAVGPPPRFATSDGWREALDAWARALLARYLAHPWAVDVPVGSTTMTRNQTLWLEAALRALRPAGLSLPERLSVVLLLSSHVAATARFRRDRRAASASDAGLPVELLDREELQDVLEAFARGHLSDPDGEEHEFAFGVACILEGARSAAAEGRAHPPDRTATATDG